MTSMADDNLFDTRNIDKYNQELSDTLALQEQILQKRREELGATSAEYQQLKQNFEESKKILIEENAKKVALEMQAAALKQATGERAKLNEMIEDANRKKQREQAIERATEEQRKKARLAEIAHNGVLAANAKDRQREIQKEIEKEKESLAIREQGIRSLLEDGYDENSDVVKQARRDTDNMSARIAQLESQSETNEQLIKILESVRSTVASIGSSIINLVDRNIGIYSQYMGKVTARLQSLDATTGKSFDTVVDKISTLGTSPYISQKELYANIDKLSSEGISYNLEERAFLATLSDKIVNSFDVGNSTLTRLIRLYQEDFTQAMLGSEAWLTQLFNTMYEDTSYLKNIDDNILSALTDVMATLDRSDALEFQYNIQKWLGSLYEVGVSGDTLLGIASAINALGTGNAQAFESSNSSTLLNLAIARSDYSLADILTKGLTGEAVNDILKSVVELLFDIKENTSNQATLNAYANVMGVSLSDIRGFYNLHNDITELYNQTMDIQTAENEVTNQLTEIIQNRTTMQEKIDTALDNFGVTIGMNIADSTAQYLSWIIGKSLVSIGSHIPGMVGTGASLAGYASLFGVMGSGAIEALLSDDDKLGVAGLKKIVNGFRNIMDVFNGNNLVDFLLTNTDLSVTGNRGSAYVGVKPEYGSVTSSISSSISATRNIGSTENMYRDIAGSIAAEMSETSGLVNLEPLSSQSGYGYDVFSAESENEGYNEYDIFEELFYHQDHPIRVHLAYFDEQAMSQLKNDGDGCHMDSNYSHLTTLYNQATGLGIPTELGGSDVSTLMTGIYSVKLG